MIAYRHTNGDDGDGCVPCYFETVEAIVNGAEPVPGCREPADDGEGYCAICGHHVEPVGSPHTPLQGGTDRGVARRPPPRVPGSGVADVASVTPRVKSPTREGYES